ncbi:MAG: aldo/keto reductase, partial [Synechococcus sp.]
MVGIGFGTWAWGNQLLWGYNPDLDDSVLESTFQQAVAGGLCLVDTADSYGTGFLNGR